VSRRIRSGLFTVLLVVWPIAVTIGQDWFPSDSGLNIPFAIASVIFYVMCAFALRSRTIAGTLWGLSIWPFNHACRWTRRMENSTLGVWNPWLGLGDRLGSHSFLQAAKVGFAKYLIPK
jgi:hypothetical protein